MPVLLERAEIIADIMKGFSTNRLMELMSISKSLASTNVERYREWTPEFTTENAKQAILTFTGEVFKSMNTKTFEQEDFMYAQKSIRILSGLYGVLRPLDLIMPYRLEMGIHLANPAGSNLYAYWREVVTKSINNDLEETQSQALINLASDEYFKVIDTKLVTKTHYYTNIFRIYRIETSYCCHLRQESQRINERICHKKTTSVIRKN